eukprot:6213012-Pleurochrysis_carterae.AAC.3
MASHTPLHQQTDFISVLNARLLFRRTKEPVGDSVVWNSSDPAYSVINASHPKYQHWSEPDENERAMVCSEPAANLVYTFNGWYVGNYGHFLHDHLPVISWLKEVMPPKVMLLMVRNSLHAQVMETVDSQFAAERIHWLEFDTLACAKEARLVAQPGQPWRDQGLARQLRAWIRPASTVSLLPKADTEALTIYYSRVKTPTVLHGRLMDPEHEKAILAVVQAKMRAAFSGINARLVVYNGHKDDGSQMPIMEQARLFQAASFVLGPHGSGLANVLWLPNVKPYLRLSNPQPGRRNSDAEHSCHHRPSVLEFICGERSAVVQYTCPHEKTYWFLYAVVFWAEYHHILFAPNSTKMATYVRLDELELALDHIFQ